MGKLFINGNFLLSFVGKMFVVNVDSRGRVLIPKELRDKVKIREGTRVKVDVKEGKIVIEPLKPIADKFYGAFEVKSWPDDLDSFIVKAVEEWWSTRGT